MSGRDAVAIAIVGAGRMGQGLALALTARGCKTSLFGRDWDPGALRRAAVVILAVPDDAISAAAAALVSRDAVAPHHTVLHLSGLLDRESLAPLAGTGAARGSFHPLQSVADPTRAPRDLAGAYAAIEGDARAVATGKSLAEALGMKAVEIPAASKPAYHAAAAIVSNYTVTLLAVAQRIATDAGIPPTIAAELYIPLLRGTVENLTHSAPAQALTGPIRRGDVATIRAHLAALAPAARSVYRELAQATLAVAIQAGLDPTKAAAIQTLLAATT